MSGPRTSKCVKLDLTAPAWSILTENLFYGLVNSVRPKLEHDISIGAQFDEPAIIGARTKDNARVLSVLRSNASEAEFKAAPITWIYDALLFSAQSDAWYAIEKKYAEEKE